MLFTAEAKRDGVPQVRFFTWVLGFSSLRGAPGSVFYLGLGVLFSAGCPRQRFFTWLLGFSSPRGAPGSLFYLGLGVLFSAGCPR